MPEKPEAPAPRSGFTMAVVALTACVVFTGFVALGNWQIERRAWKLDLIERVDQRVHAAPSDAPSRQDWPQVSAADDEYRHVKVIGHFLHADTTLVHASSYQGYGYWMLTPLRTTVDFVVWVNRGYLPADLPHSDRYKQLRRPLDLVQITGLLRLTEPEGTLLRANKPEQGSWYSRDVFAMTKAAGLNANETAPYFIDADAGSDPAQQLDKYPAGGLTVVNFRNNHLVYAITWYALAGLTVIGACILGRYEWRARFGRP